MGNEKRQQPGGFPPDQTGWESDEAVADRIRRAAEGIGGLSELSRRSGIPLSSINAYVREAKLPFDRAFAISEATGLSLDWFATGQPEYQYRLADHPPLSPRQLAALEASGYIQAQETSVAIPQFDARASAGPGAFSDEDRIIGRITLDAAWIQGKVGVSPERLFAIVAIGNSMQPTIESGDLLVVERYMDQVYDGAIYVVVRAGAVIVKRLQTAGPRTIVLRGDNPSSKEEVIGPDDPDETVIIGRVRIIARTL